VRIVLLIYDCNTLMCRFNRAFSPVTWCYQLQNGAIPRQNRLRHGNVLFPFGKENYTILRAAELNLSAFRNKRVSCGVDCVHILGPELFNVLIICKKWQTSSEVPKCADTTDLLRLGCRKERGTFKGLDLDYRQHYTRSVQYRKAVNIGGGKMNYFYMFLCPKLTAAPLEKELCVSEDLLDKTSAEMPRVTPKANKILGSGKTGTRKHSANSVKSVWGISSCLTVPRSVLPVSKQFCQEERF